jgi:hypothetical protein
MALILSTLIIGNFAGALIFAHFIHPPAVGAFRLFPSTSNFTSATCQTAERRSWFFDRCHTQGQILMLEAHKADYSVCQWYSGRNLWFAAENSVAYKSYKIDPV